MFKSNNSSPREQYQLNLEKASILALLLVILLFILFPKIRINNPVEREGTGTALTVEDIPITRQASPRKPPPRPVVPIPSEDELFPEDITIQDTELTFETYSSLEGSGRRALEQFDVIQPRPVFEVIPEYSEELQKKGIEGRVKLHLHVDKTGQVINVVILENTTESTLCANAAKEAAMKGRYIPAKRNGEPTDLWITRTYTFGLQK